MDYFNKEEILFIVPARSGSKGIVDKNIRLVEGHPLLAYSIAAAKLSIPEARVIVSTDSVEYASIAKSYGAEIPFLRPDSISRSNSLDIEYLTHALNKIMEIEGNIPEYIVLLRPTTPLRDPTKIQEAIDLIKSNKDATSVVSVFRTPECPYKWLLEQKDGFLASPFAELSADDVNLPRQSFPTLLIPDGYVDVLRSGVILEKQCVYGEKAIPYLLDTPSIDIDRMEDMMRINSAGITEYEILKYLDKIKEKLSVTY